jgi:hypothetical protein
MTGYNSRKRGDKEILFEKREPVVQRKLSVLQRTSGVVQRVMASMKAGASTRATKKQCGKQETTQEKESQGWKEEDPRLENFPRTGRKRGHKLPQKKDTRTRKGSRRRTGTQRTKEENLLCSKNLGIATFMILEKQENHLPRLKEKVKKEFHTYSTQLLPRKNILS